MPSYSVQIDLWSKPGTRSPRVKPGRPGTPFVAPASAADPAEMTAEESDERKFIAQNGKGLA